MKIIIVYNENNISIVFYLYSSDRGGGLNHNPKVMFQIAHNMSLGHIYFHIDNEEKDLTISNKVKT